MTFDPARHGFFELDFTFPGEVAVYELDLQGVDQSQHDTMRLNCYLSCPFRLIRPLVPTTSAHLFRAIRPSVVCRVET